MLFSRLLGKQNKLRQMSAKTIHSRNREIQSFTTTMASKHQQRLKHKQIFKGNKADTHDIF
jgi:hypothetical protein